MLHIRNIELENLVTYKEASFDFTKGMHIVRGENRAGKSLLFSSLANLFYFAPPLEVKKNTAKLMHRSGSRLSVSVCTGDTDFKLSQLGKKSSISWEIQKDKLNLQQRVDIKEYIKSTIFPLPEDLFYTSVYLNAFKPSRLLNGKANERHDFFESLLDLNVHDALRQSLSEYLVTIKSDLAELRVISNSANTLKESVQEKGGLEDLRKLYQDSRDSLNALRKKFMSKQKYLDNISTYISIQKQVEENVPLDDLEKELHKLNSRLEALEGTQEQRQKVIIKLSEQIAEMNAFKRQSAFLDKLKKRVPDLKVTDLPKLQKNLKDAERRIEDLKNKIEAVEAFSEAKAPISTIVLTQSFSSSDVDFEKALCSHIKQTILKSELDKPTLKEHNPPTLERLIALLGELAKKYYALQNQLRVEVQELESTSGVCPTCNQKVKDHASLLKNKKAELKRVSALAKKYDSYFDFLIEVDRLLEANLEFEVGKGIDLTSSYDELQSDYLSAEKRITKLQNCIETLEKIQECSNMFKDRKVVTASDISNLEEKLEKLQDKVKNSNKLQKDLKTRRETIIQNISLLERLKDLKLPDFLSGKTLTDIDQFYRKTISQVEVLNKDIDKLSDTAERTKVDMELLKQDLRTLKDYEKKLAKYEELLENQKIYEALITAYGGRGIRTFQVKNIVEMFIENLNSYSQLLFPEPFVFSASITPGQCTLMAERNYVTQSNKATGLISDVRLLSGSESRSFQFLSFLSLLPFLPSHLRCNTVIFDELETGMSENSLALLTREFLPQLQELIDCVVFITPQSSRNFSVIGAKEYVVKKVNSISRLIPQQ